MKEVSRRYARKKDSAQLALISSPAWRCAKCGYRTTANQTRCPMCHAWGAFIEIGDVSEESSPVWSPEPLAKVQCDKVQRVNLEDKALNRFFGGGPVRTCSYLFSAPPGAGKSTWALQCGQFFDSPLYVAAEEAKGAIKLRANRVKSRVSHMHIVETQDLELVAKNISNVYDALIIDSTHRMRTDDTTAPIGSAQQVENVIALASDIVRKLGIVGMFIGHMNKELDPSGKLASQHDVDGTITILVEGAQRTFVMNKHRHGETPARVECEMTGAGLDGFRFVEDES